MVDGVLGCVSLGEGCEFGQDLVVVVYFKEFEVGRRFEQVGDTLGLLHAREFEQDLACLVLELLDVGGHDAELVDTCAEDIEGSVNLALHLLLERGGHLGIRRRVLQFAEEFTLAAEEAGHCAGLEVGSHFLHEVLVGGFRTLLLSLCDGVVDLTQRGFAVGILAEDVGHRDFEHHVHTPFEVKTEADLHFAHLIVGVAQIDFLFVD